MAARSATAQARTLAALVRRLRRDPRIEAVILVGSLAAGQADALSDIDLLVMVRPSDFPAVWRTRRKLAREAVHVVHASEETGGRPDVGTYRVLTADRIAVELALFAKGSAFRLGTPYRLLFGKTSALEGMPRLPVRMRTRLLPGGPPDLPFALQDIAKHWVRGQRARARAELRTLARTVAPGVDT
jgi:predicted nucleotidyltransferase